MISRTTQPYRKGPREIGPALMAMMRGTTAYGDNPADVERGLARMARARRGKRARPRRPPRAQRPPR